MINSLKIIVCTTIIAITMPAFAAVTNLQEAAYWLEGKSQQLVRQSRLSMNDGTAAFAPQAGSTAYDAFWLRDYAYMVEGCPEAFTAQELKNAALTFIKATDANGAGVDCVRFNGTPCYQPGYGDHNFGMNPALDGYMFTVDVSWRAYQQTKDAAFLNTVVKGNTVIDNLLKTLNAVPRDATNGLPYITTGLVRGSTYDRVGWGFTDGVQKTGNELMCSLLYYRACNEVADLLDAAGRTSEATTWRTTANDKKAKIQSVFWNGSTGLFKAATIGESTKMDIMGSAYAVQLGVATTEQANAVAAYLDTHYNEIVKEGQVRHLPGGVYWDNTISGKDQYQNGMFWGVASGWVASTLRLVDHAKSDQMLLDMVNNYQAKNDVNEYVNASGTPSGVKQYVSSATMPLVVLKQLSSLPSQPTFAQLGGNLDANIDIALATNGGTAFAKNLLPGYPNTHTIPHLNDGAYGNGNSWIGSTVSTFCGVSFKQPCTISSLAFGRDNKGVYNDRYAGMYIFQYTQTPNPNESTPDAQWTSFGSFALDKNTTSWGDGSASYLRHVYKFDPISGATGVRILLDTANGDNICIDELEVYAVPEPGTMTLATLGVAGFFLHKHCKAKCHRIRFRGRK